MQWYDFVLCGIFHANGINSLRELNKAIDQNDKASEGEIWTRRRKWGKIHYQMSEGRPRVLFKVLQERIAVSRKTFTWAPRTFPGQQRRAIHHLRRVTGMPRRGQRSRPHWRAGQRRAERGARVFFSWKQIPGPDVLPLRVTTSKAAISVSARVWEWIS